MIKIIVLISFILFLLIAAQPCAAYLMLAIAAKVFVAAYKGTH